MSEQISDQVPFREALEALRGASLPSAKTLLAFTDLEGEQLAQWIAVWQGLPDERRATLIEHLIEVSEDDIQANFDALFRHALGDRLERVRLSAIEGLSRESHPSAMETLIDLLQHDPSLTVRAAAAESLGRFVLAAEAQQLPKDKGMLVFRALISTLRRTPTDSILYRRTLESLAFTSHPEVDYHIRTAYHSDDDLLLVSALVAMGRSSNPEYRPLVRAELHNISPLARRTAAIAAGELEDEEALPDLLKLLDDPNDEVQIATLTALAQINHPDARQAIARATRSNNPTISQHAESALQEWDFWHKEVEFPMLDIADEAHQSFTVQDISEEQQSAEEP